jgi:hypothetical protein
LAGWHKRDIGVHGKTSLVILYGALTAKVTYSRAGVGLQTRISNGDISAIWPGIRLYLEKIILFWKLLALFGRNWTTLK